MYERKVMLGFIRTHILHHAVKDGGIYGVEMMEELRSHGYSISPGTLYPIFHEMKKDGALSCSEINVNGKIRKVYNATSRGEQVLEKLKLFITELSEEVLG